MMVLDENALEQYLVDSIRRWYPGRVLFVTDLRPLTLVKDESIPTLLLRWKGITFVTTNVSDFWRKVPAHYRYAIVCLDLPNEAMRTIPALLRRVLQLPEFRTRASRMGKILRVSPRRLHYYTTMQQRPVALLAWTQRGSG